MPPCPLPAPLPRSGSGIFHTISVPQPRVLRHLTFFLTFPAGSYCFYLFSPNRRAFPQSSWFPSILFTRFSVTPTIVTVTTAASPDMNPTQKVITDTNKSPLVQVLTLMFLVIALLACSVRTGTKIRMIKTLRADDILTIVASVSR